MNERDNCYVGYDLHEMWRQNRTQACATGMNNGKKFYPIQSLIINFIQNQTDVTH
jgi:hypothetical protein